MNVPARGPSVIVTINAPATAGIFTIQYAREKVERRRMKRDCLSET
ncbi:hypothetical protein GGD55_004997 [Rhizobium giardinii]|jgi:hypothetical protein|uniref:Uncharacterized protein n=1 Tax=Rhizobium giardinii TaxID=56731 RepID=A0A7W8UF54_9HYPH|nr:hypothetical protein [Rhizobium giardinii]